MIAVDTNVLIRFLTRDEPQQAAVTRELFASENVWIAKTVLLETDWVLRSVHGLTQAAIRQSLLELTEMHNVLIEDGPAVTAALKLGEQGIDLADALHLSSRPPGTTFATFDRALARRAKRAGEVSVRELPARRPAP